MGADISTITKALSETIGKLSDNFTKPLSEGISVVRDAQNNVYNIVKNAETGLVTIITKGQTIFEDVEKNLFKLASQVVSGVFETIQIAEKGIIKGGLEIERGVIAGGRQIEADISTQIAETTRLGFNTFRSAQRDIVVVVDEQMDKIQSTTRKIVDSSFETLQFSIIIVSLAGTYFAIRYGDDFYRDVMKIFEKLADRGINLSLV